VKATSVLRKKRVPIAAHGDQRIKMGVTLRRSMAEEAADRARPSQKPGDRAEDPFAWTVISVAAENEGLLPFQ
jgi:hypothetical protein